MPEDLKISKIVHATEASFSKVVLESPLPVAVVFGASRCPDCRAYDPVVGEMSKEYEGRMTFVKVNSDENRGLVERYMTSLNIRAIPTTMFFIGGKPTKDCLIENTDRQVLKKAVESILLKKDGRK